VGVQQTGRPRDVSCDEILAAHSDYLDGLLPSHDAARVQWHLASCASCSRYDRIVRRSSELVRELPDVEPSDDFAERLQHRLYHLQDGAAIAGGRSPGAGAAATVAVAGFIALLAWSPVFMGGGDAADTASMGYTSMTSLTLDTYRQPEGAVGMVATSDDGWNTAGIMPLTAPALLSLGEDDTVVRVLAAFPGPYSPLVVSPPVHRTVRQVE
jgi:predicted anti-sigma-YlaC factor YlaD